LKKTACREVAGENEKDQYITKYNASSHVIPDLFLPTPLTSLTLQVAEPLVENVPNLFLIMHLK
jgi:hypothetical protein